MIVLQQPVEEQITVPAGADLVLDLNGHELKAAAGTPVTVNGGKLTVKDSTAVQDCDYSGEVPAAQYKGGAIVAEKANGVQVTNGGEFTLLSGKVRAQNIGVSVVGNIAAGADREAIASKAYIKGGYVLCQEYGVSPQGKGAYISVEGDAFIEALDNAAVAGNGNVTDKEDRGGTTIDINGGIIVSHIQSKGYIACGIYHPQAGTLNITDGEIYAENGVGILMRAGKMSMTGGFLVTTGNVTGKVGDSQVNIGCDGIVVEGAPSKYPGIATGGLDAVIGGNAIILPQHGDTLKLNKVEVNGEEKGTLVVEGGAAAGAEVAETVEPKGTITVAASPTPHAEILAEAAKILAKEGWTLKVTEFEDYVQPNLVVDSGEIDANYFQHTPYLDDFNEKKGTDLVAVAAIHYEPFGIYPGTKTALSDLTDGDVIAVPNDTTNEARALLLLQDNGVIKLADGAGLAATVKDIVENPHNVKIQELEAAQVSRVKDEVAFVVLNGNYALQAGFSVAHDAVAYETSASAAAKTYANVLVVKAGNENNEGVQALVKVLKSDEIKQFINDTYDGAVIPFED